MPGSGRPVYYDFDLFNQSGQHSGLDERPLNALSYTAFDSETTGLEPSAGDEIISLGAVRIVNGRLLRSESFDQLIDPGRPIDPESAKIHGIRRSMLAGQPNIGSVLPAFHRFCDMHRLAWRNAAFDLRFLQLKEASTGLRFGQPVLDTLLLSALLHDGLEDHRLEAIAKRMGVDVIARHTALGDAMLTAEVFLKMLPLLASRGIVTLRQARELLGSPIMQSFATDTARDHGGGLPMAPLARIMRRSPVSCAPQESIRSVLVTMRKLSIGSILSSSTRPKYPSAF